MKFAARGRTTLRAGGASVQTNWGWIKHNEKLGFYSDLMGFYSDLMGFYSDLMGYYWYIPSGIFSIKIGGFFHSHGTVYQRVNLHFPIGFLMVFLWVNHPFGGTSHGFNPAMAHRAGPHPG
jgi:hypothetical protein